MQDLRKKIIIGSAQFGLDYGVNNGKIVGKKEVSDILGVANQNGIFDIDTATDYGRSQAVLGSVNKKRSGFKFISKVSRAENKRDLKFKIEQCLEDLGVDSLEALLIHDFNFFKSNQWFYDAMLEMRETAMFKKIGFSLYFPEELSYLLDRKLKFDIVQIPYNVFDRRFESYFKCLVDLGVEIHVRSVFLQGLFFLEDKILKEKFSLLYNNVKELQNICLKNNLKLHELLLNFVLNREEVSKLVLGIDSKEQLLLNLKALGRFEVTKSIMDKLRDKAVLDESLILPINWK